MLEIADPIVGRTFGGGAFLLLLVHSHEVPFGMCQEVVFLIRPAPTPFMSQTLSVTPAIVRTMDRTSLLDRLYDTEKLLEDPTTDEAIREQLKELAADLRVAVAMFLGPSLGK